MSTPNFPVLLFLHFARIAYSTCPLTPSAVVITTTTIVDSLYSGCEKIISVVIPSMVTSIGKL